jgi:hypothetical protein
MPIPHPLDPPAQLLCRPVPSDVEPTAVAARRRPMLGRLDPTFHAVVDEDGVRGPSLKGATAMSHRSSGSSSPPSAPSRLERSAWDAALRPAQRRAGLGRARLEQRRLAEARRQRLIMGWLRELANR